MFLRKNQQGCLSLLNWIGTLTLFLLLKLPCKKNGALIHSMMFLSPEVACISKSTIQPCIEYCCYAWAGNSGCYLEMLDKLQKRVCRTIGPSLPAFLEPLAHR